MATRDASAPSMADGAGDSRWTARFAARLEALAEAERAHFSLWRPVGLLMGIAAWFWLRDRSG